MSNQVLTIDPKNELKFKGTFEQGCITYLRLGNPTSDVILFKIKTTAPKKYCVRPNSGYLKPNSKVEIAITPQPVYLDPNEKHKHKFMVQSALAPVGMTDVDLAWKDINSDSLMDYKLKCVFEHSNSNTNDSGDNIPQNEITKKRIDATEDAKPSTKEAVENLINKEVKRLQDEAITSGTLSAKTNLVFTKSDNENELQKASQEVMHLREEESKLRQEYLQLKEEVLRLRQAVSEDRAPRAHSFGPEKQQQAVVPWLGIAVAMALIGIVIGKFLM